MLKKSKSLVSRLLCLAALCSMAASAQTTVGIPYQTGFDSGAAGWTTSCSPGTCWELGTPTAAGTNGPFSFPNVWGTDLDSGYTANAQAVLTSPYFQSPTALIPYLSFYQFRYMSTGLDGMFVETQTNNQPWVLLTGSGGDTLNWYNSPSVFAFGHAGFTGNSGGWIQSGIRLSALAVGDSMRIRFSFRSNSSFGSAQPGVFIDDLSIADSTGSTIDVFPLYLIQPVGGLGPAQNFDVKAIIKNQSLNTIDSVRIGFSVNGGAFSQQTIPFGLPPGVQDTFLFGNTILPVGYNVIRLFATTNGDGNTQNDTIASGIFVANSKPIPYFNDFESDTSGWGDATLGITRWEYGTPAYGLTTGAFSGTKCWDTDLDSGYVSNAFATLISPPFDFRTTTAPFLEFALNCKTEDGWDGVRVDYSTNDGATWSILGTVADPLAQNWYTDSQLNSSGQPAWEGPLPGWIRPRYRLSFLNGFSAVRFKYIFTSDGSVNADGVSLDDFRIDELPEFDLRLDTLRHGLFAYPTGSTSDSITLVITNMGGLPATGYTCAYSVNGVPTGSVLLNTALNSGQTQTVSIAGFTIPQGVSTLCASINWSQDQFPADNVLCSSVAGVPTASIPAVFDFDTGSAGWITRSSGPGGAVTNWELGTPQYGQTSSAFSPPSCWDINLDTTYAPQSVCELYSPIFDLASAIRPELVFQQNRNINLVNDGLRVDYRLNNDTSWRVLGNYLDANGQNWYNRYFIGNSTKPGWDGSSNGWNRCSYNLDSAFVGTGTVQFRLVFSSGNFSGMDGVSIDDFSILTDYPNDASLAAVISPVGSYISGVSAPLTVRLLNAGTNPLNAITIRYVLNGIPGTYGWNGFLPGDSSTLVTLGQGLIQGGLNELIAWTDWPFDQNQQNDTIRHTFYGIPTLPLPYSENFESGEGGWYNALNTPSTIWEYGTPGFAPLNTAHSGNYCWDVNLIGPYGNLAAAYLASPGFDLGTASEVLISCWENHRTEAFADGAFWEYSVNGQTWQRLGEVNDSLGSNWYNGALYGGRSGWSGIGNGWTPTSYRYKPASGSSYLRLRMVFISDPSIIDAGFSLDDISITAVTGLAETYQDKQALIMPNPTSNLFQIEIPEIIQGIVVWDASGRKITEMTTTDVSNRFIGSAETWAEGTYIIRAQGKSGQLYSVSLLVLPRQ